jgi:hypothetical protein
MISTSEKLRMLKQFRDLTNLMEVSAEFLPQLATVRHPSTLFDLAHPEAL